jgi:DNA-binding Lrp family transcriptional regulator
MEQERKILELFLFNYKLKFNEIEKQLKIRSNKLAYHLKQLVNKEILTKENEEYSLSKSSEHLIPYLSDKQSVLPVILIHIGDKKQVFLYSREKRPFKDKLSLPGGRLLIKESIGEATARIIKSKFNINAKLKTIHSVSLEHVKNSGSKFLSTSRIEEYKDNSLSVKNDSNKVHSFLLIFVSATTKEKIMLTNIEKNRVKIISSDYKLLKNNLDSDIKIKSINSRS